MPSLNCYGENSFTFMLFQALHRHRLTRDVLLANLKQFGTAGRRFQVEDLSDQDGEPEVWLFPNFGKRHGFGEPDALVLTGGHQFWFEVESYVDLVSDRSGLEQALRQLLRFHFFRDAVRRGAKTRRFGVWHRAIIGPTITNRGDVKLGILRVAGHKPLERLRKAYPIPRSNYVVLSHGQPRGLGGPERFGASLGRVLEEVRAEVRATMLAWAADTAFPAGGLPPMPGTESFWYAYWNGDLRDKYLERVPTDPLVDGGYVGPG